MHVISILAAVAVPLAAALPNPAISDASASPHFLTGVYGVLRTSGDRVGRAAERVLGVQGSLDDLKDDLSTEYDRWKKKQKELTARREEITRLIQEQESTLREQRSLQALAERLRGDLAAEKAETEKVKAKHEHDSKEWKQQHLDLNKDIDTVQKDTEESALERQQIMNATRNRTDAILAHQRVVEVETLQLNEAVRKTKSVRDQHTANTSRVESEILAETTAVRRRMGDVQLALQGQGQIALEEARLASQADQVARKRAEIDERMYNCTDGLRVMDAQVAAASKAADQATAELRHCQDLDASNQDIEARISACRAESVATR